MTLQTGEAAGISQYRTHLEATIKAAAVRVEDALAEMAAVEAEIYSHEDVNSQLASAGCGAATAGGMAVLMESAHARKTAAKQRLCTAEQAKADAEQVFADLHSGGHVAAEESVKSMSDKPASIGWYQSVDSGSRSSNEQPPEPGPHERLEPCGTPWYHDPSDPRHRPGRVCSCEGTGWRRVCKVCSATNCDGVHDFCLNCDGTTEVTCPTCEGDERLYPADDDDGDGVPCHGCNGSGSVPCPACTSQPKDSGRTGGGRGGYDAEVAAILEGFAEGPCPTCGQGVDDHTFAADEDNHAHAWCNAADGEAPSPASTPPESPSRTEVIQRIRDAYKELVADPGDGLPAFVGLRRLREHLADVSRADLDAALDDLYRNDRGVHMEPEINQKTLTDADWDAAVRLAGEEKHLLAIDPAPPGATP